MTPASLKAERRCRRLRVALALWAGAALLFATSLMGATAPVLALSEIQREELPPPATGTPPGQAAPEQTVPTPDPVQPPGGSETEKPDTEEPAETSPPGDQQAPQEPDGTEAEPDEPLPEIQYDLTKLPEPVQNLRDRILEAAKSGDLERLRPLLGSGDEQTQLALGGISGDPIAYLKELAGDEEGQEILAILEEVLSAGYVHMDAGTPNDLYIWPYFFAVPLDKLTAPQRVELFKIITAGDYDDMKAYGAYIFYRIGITPDGKWSFFIAGD